MRKLIAAFLFIATSSSAFAAPHKERVAVLEFVTEGGVAPVVGNQMTAKLADLVGRRPDTTVIAPDDIRALLERESQKQLLGCSEESCLAEIGMALGADLLLKGRVGSIDGGFAISLSAVKTSNAQAVAHVSDTWMGESIALLDVLEPMVDRVFASGQSLVGSVELSGAASGSTATLDGQLGLDKVAVGAHRLVVAKEGYVPFETWIVVRTNLKTTVPIMQKSEPSDPIYAAWWFWTAAAVAAGGAAVGTALIVSGGGEHSSGTGIQIGVNADTALQSAR